MSFTHPRRLAIEAGYSSIPTSNAYSFGARTSPRLGPPVARCQRLRRCEYGGVNRPSEQRHLRLTATIIVTPRSCSWQLLTDRIATVIPRNGWRYDVGSAVRQT